MKNDGKMNIELSPLLGKRLLCAVSGGADSMCLLHWLHSNNLEVTAAHFEHGIRAKESERDLQFVKDYCRAQSIPFVYGRGDVPAYAKEHGMSTEEAARKLRYEFLEEKRSELCMDLILTAHNAGDNAETLVFNLIRGSGTRGLKGIDAQRDRILRPMLKVSRAQIEAYLDIHSIPHVEDSTNRSDDYTRNFIRHRLIPLMEEINPRFLEAAGRTAELCRRDEEALNALASRFHAENYSSDGSIGCKSLAEELPAISSRCLRQELPGLSMEQIDSILDFCRGEGCGELAVHGRRLYRDSGRLYFEKPRYIPLSEHLLVPGKDCALPECGIQIHSEIVEYTGEVNGLFKTYFLKYEIIGADILIGSRAPGDRMRPAGRGLTKSLKSLFLEKNIPVFKRDNIPVLRDKEGDILMVYGVAVDQRAQPKPGDKALKLEFRNIITGELE